MPRKNKDSHRAYCRDYAAKHSEEAKARARTFYEENRDAINLFRRTDPDFKRKNISRSLAFRTGGTLELKEALIEKQKGRCAACDSELGDSPRNRCLDHDHKTNAIREVLCTQCNTALGMVQDSVDRLEKLILYLCKHTVQSETTGDDNE